MNRVSSNYKRLKNDGDASLVLDEESNRILMSMTVTKSEDIPVSLQSSELLLKVLRDKAISVAEEIESLEELITDIKAIKAK